MITRMNELLREHGVQFKEYGEQDHHVSQGWINVDCCYCSAGSNSFRLGYNVQGKYWSCWQCGGHPAVATLAKLLNLPYKACIPLWEGVGATYRETEAPRGKLEVPYSVGPLLSQHKKYLRARGYIPEEIERLWGIKGIGLARSLSWRIFIPIHIGGRIVSWTTRAITDSVKLRYISAKKHQEEYPLKSLLYGEHLCNHTIIVNEGPLDAWTFGPGGVATCGVGYSREQLLRMSRFPVRVICFDAEPIAQRRAMKLVNDLAVFKGETYNVTLSAKDASRTPKEEIEELKQRFLT